MPPKKNKEPKKPAIIIPLTTKEFPRVEVFIDNLSATVGLKKKKLDTNYSIQKFCSNTPEGILKTLDKVMFTQKLNKATKENYNATFEEFMELVREHNKFMEDLAKEVKK